VKCGCKLSKTILEYRESKWVMCFLKGLGETYNNVKIQILLMELLPGINIVFSLTLQKERQEKHLNKTSTMESKILINNTSQSNQPTSQFNHKYYNRNVGGWKGTGRGKRKNFGKQWSYYKMNDTADECYSKHGHPPWIKQRISHATNVVENLEDQINERSSPQDKSLNNQIVNALSTEQLQKIVDILQMNNDKGKPIMI